MPSIKRVLLGMIMGTVVAATATSASAHAHLDTSLPAANSVVASPSTITLHFTEALEPRFSGFDITDARGHAVRAPSHADTTNASVLVATLGAPLSPGVYHVNWHIVAHDGHRMRGTFDFTVRA